MSDQGRRGWDDGVDCRGRGVPNFERDDISHRGTDEFEQFVVAVEYVNINIGVPDGESFRESLIVVCDLNAVNRKIPVFRDHDTIAGMKKERKLHHL